MIQYERVGKEWRAFYLHEGLYYYGFSSTKVGAKKILLGVLNAKSIEVKL